MKTFNLTQIVTFPTKIFNNKGMLIDSIFLDNMKYNSMSVYPLEKGLSDHDAQILVAENMKLPLQTPAHKNKTWTADEQTIPKFQMLLKEETWYTVYNADNVKRMFNNFHCIHLRHFENSFPVSYRSYTIEHNNWITKGIKTSCKRKRTPYNIYRNTNHLQVKEYYKKYCMILRRVIIETEKLHYNNKIKKFSNKVKTVSKIIKDTTGQTQSCDMITKINSEAGQLTDTKEIANVFNNFFIQYAGNLNNKHINVHKALQFVKEANPKTMEMNALLVTETEMINTIKSLNKNS
jgi:hypothetical protein